MLFAIDFDGTFARDMDLFGEWLVIGRRMGHTFVLVTGRSDVAPWGDEVRRAVAGRMPIVFAADGWKRAAAEAAGYKVDVWIEDHPEYIDRQDPSICDRKDGYTAESPFAAVYFAAKVAAASKALREAMAALESASPAPSGKAWVVAQDGTPRLFDVESEPASV